MGFIELKIDCECLIIPHAVLNSYDCIQEVYLTFHATTVLASANIIWSLYFLKITSSMHSTDQGHESHLGKHIVPLAFWCNRVAAILC